MRTLSTDVETRIRAALNERLGESGMVTRFHRHNDTIYLEVVAPLGLARTAKSVEQALDSIGAFLRSEKLYLDVTISSPWQPRWQSQAMARSSDQLDFAAAPRGRRATG